MPRTTTDNSAPLCKHCSQPLALNPNGRYGPVWHCEHWKRDGSGCKGCFVKYRTSKSGWSAPVIEREPFSRLDGTDEQEDIWDEVLQGTNHILVNALAGTGKTTTSVQLLHRLPNDIAPVFLAFNTSVRDTLLRKTPASSNVLTVNALGHRACVIAFAPKNKRRFFNKEKIDNILRQLLDGRELNKAGAIKSATKKLVSLLKGTMKDPNEDNMATIIEAFSIETEAQDDIVMELAEQVYRISMEDTSCIDFDDQVAIGLKVIKDVKSLRSDLVIVDELQDLNEAKRELVLGAMTTDGRFMGVGDERQAIYSFMGADSESIPNFREHLEDTSKGLVELPLTTCFRCPTTHLELATKIVQEITPAPGAIEGNVFDIKPQDVIPTIKEKGITKALILHRRNAPAVSYCLHLWGEGIKAIVRGKDVGGRLLAMIDSNVTGLDTDTINGVGSLLHRIESYVDDERAKLSTSKRQDAQNMSEMLQDQYDCIQAVSTHVKSINELKKKILDIFDDNTKDVIVLSTIHKAKGDESPIVFLGEPSKMDDVWGNNDIAAQERDNINYVAMTRCTQEGGDYYFIADDNTNRPALLQ